MAVWTRESAALSLAAPPEPARRSSTYLADALRRLGRDKIAVLSAAIILVIVLAAILAPLVAPYGYAQADLGGTWAPPSRAHLLGTDAVGRDVLSRLIFGARISMSVAFMTIVIVLLVGVPVGAIAGFVGGRLDAAIMRVIDAMYAFPDLLFVIAFTTFYKALIVAAKKGGVVWLTGFDGATGGTLGILVAVGVTYWLNMARVVRSQTLSIKQREYIDAARCMGATETRLLWRHVLPNCLAPIIVTASLYLPQAIMVEASLGFLGLGVDPPLPSWGVMLAEGLTSMRSAPYLVLAPAAAVAIAMLAFNFLGDSLRDALDPSLRQ
jgi:oligopeptide transport system permease protein